MLKQQIDSLKRQLFGGGKSEKIDRDQALLALGEMEARQKQMQEQQVSYTRSKPTGNRKSATERFEKVPVTETVEIVPEEVKADPDLYEAIGADETFEIDITPPRSSSSGSSAGLSSVTALIEAFLRWWLQPPRGPFRAATPRLDWSVGWS